MCHYIRRTVHHDNITVLNWCLSHLHYDAFRKTSFIDAISEHLGGVGRVKALILKTDQQQAEQSISVAEVGSTISSCVDSTNLIRS